MIARMAESIPPQPLADSHRRPGYNAAMANAVEIGSLIDRDPEIRGGRPKIAGTGVTVMRVAGRYKLGLTPEEIAAEYGHLSLAQIHTAPAYYHANPDEIEADLAEEDIVAAQLERERIPRAG